jgi:hypothetical protein
MLCHHLLYSKSMCSFPFALLRYPTNFNISKQRPVAFMSDIIVLQNVSPQPILATLNYPSSPTSVMLDSHNGVRSPGLVAGKSKYPGRRKNEHLLITSLSLNVYAMVNKGANDKAVGEAKKKTPKDTVRGAASNTDPEDKAVGAAKKKTHKDTARGASSKTGPEDKAVGAAKKKTPKDTAGGADSKTGPEDKAVGAAKKNTPKDTARGAASKTVPEDKAVGAAKKKTLKDTARGEASKTGPEDKAVGAAKKKKKGPNGHIPTAALTAECLASYTKIIQVPNQSKLNQSPGFNMNETSGMGKYNSKVIKMEKDG